MLQTTSKKILLIYIEPTPYVLGLIQTLVTAWGQPIDVLFLTENLSQQWNLTLPKEWLLLPKGFFAKLKFLHRLFFKNRYQMLHIAGWGSPILQLILILARLTKTPVTVASDTPYHPVQLWKAMVKRTIYPMLFKCVDIFLAGGIRQGQYIKRYGIKENRIIPVQMTVDTLAIKKYAATLQEDYCFQIKKKYGLPANHLIFLYVGRLEIHKGIKDLITAFQKIETSTASLLIVGSGSLESYVKAEATHNSRIFYTGRLAEEAVLDAYAISDVLILPSHYEPWGLVINEAMAMNLSVIVSDRVGCIDDLIEDKINGLIFPAKNIPALQTAMQYLMDYPKELEQMSLSASQKIANWTLENEAQKICQAWHSLVSI